MLVSASILSNHYKEKDLVDEINQTGIDYIHVDVMDGKFVSNKTWTMSEVKKLLKNNTKKLDVHLMVNDPTKYINEYALLNTEYITVHAEIKKVKESIELINNYGLKAGISIKPNTKVDDILPYLKDVSLVLIMSVEPGAGGQTFMDSVLYKIDLLQKIREEKSLNFIISIDGGINDTNIELLKEKNIDMIVSGSFLHKNIKENYEILK